MLQQPTISRFFKSSSTRKKSEQRTAKEEAELMQLLESDGENNSATVPSDRKPEAAPMHVGLGNKAAAGGAVPGQVKSATRGFEDFRFNRRREACGKEQEVGFAERLQRIMERREGGCVEEDETELDNEAPRSKRAKPNRLTELDQQFKDLKLQHMDKVLAVRVGYKYKFFAEDAVMVSRVLQIKLVPGKLTVHETDPADHKHKKFAYCTIPDTRLEVHLQRLMHHNLKVGVVEQTETSAVKKNSGTSSSVFSREVTNIFTRATYGINETFGTKDRRVLGDSASVWGLVCKRQPSYTRYFLVSVNLNSGEVIFDDFKEERFLTEALETRIKYTNPSEVVVGDGLGSEIEKVFHTSDSDITLNRIELVGLYEEIFSEPHPAFKGNVPLQTALMLVHGYLTNFKNESLLFFKENFKPFCSKTHMILPSSAIESLDIFENSTDRSSKGSLLWVLDHTRTNYGLRNLKNWIAKPLINIDQIQQRLDAVQCISTEVGNIFIESLNNMLRDGQDLERILNRIAYGKTSRREVYLFLRELTQLATLFSSHHRYIETNVLSANGKIRMQSSLLANIFTDLDEYWKQFPIPNFLAMINIDAALDKNPDRPYVEYFNLTKYDRAEPLISKQQDIEAVIGELRDELKNIRVILKRPMLNYKDEIDFLVEIRNTQVSSVPVDWVKVASTKAVSRFQTPGTAKLVAKLQYHKELLQDLALQEYESFIKRITGEYTSLRKAILHLSTYDCILSLAATSCNVDYVRPKFNTAPQCINVINGRNPIIESLDVRYMPNDVNLNREGKKIMIITGPNMGGKSSYIRQVALLVIMAQIGCYVPAQEAEFSIFDQIFTRIGAYDNLLRNDSTFKIEMTEMVQILRSSTENSLLLLDEVGRGTGTHDGISISYALLRYFIELHNACPLILFITHYASLGSIRSPILGNYHMSYIEEKRPGENWPSVVFLYKLKEGRAHNSYGLNVAKLADIQTGIINRAYKISTMLKQEMESNSSIAAICTIKHALAGNSAASLKSAIETLIESADHEQFVLNM
ncbi:ADR168Cp [Eremothecium gossypii ATCC 10895]|uniref:DNA mismatch repair protein MSH3 n=1 Tax=Eremothecium gossypii (strain ATCC 10895 / CBS 109.51 / FGSC 9923 / NRRL Y-1056) TaxID=284811 RepID=MSH3_EREGS|nr:ADR168Cp [Eremothecium gossypii ATCC 10895]Q759V4.1 RecName: Full=DNA mismatch repair protein MSH3; AltName: Full=MutS protein homolog 3 [Eremothecium gossypii ATCC 10895]AAS52089.1 ADR168Cp [Eremothecium gossypii ATCC 10895]